MSCKRKNIEDLGLLKHFNSWHVCKELNIDTHEQFDFQRRKDIVAVTCSGNLMDVREINGYKNVVAGFDVIVNERYPMINKGEGELNAYGYLIQKASENRFLLIGPDSSCENTRVDHWPEGLDQLNVYLESSLEII